MRVTSRSLRNYRSAVDEQAGLARAYVKRALDAYFAANPNATTGDAREFCIELLKTSMPNFCDAAGTLAADFFDEVCEAEGIEVTSELYEATDYSIVEDKVRYFADRLNEGDAEAFKREVVDATHYFVKRSAYDNMVMNCEANGVRYARVPSGFETCPFCFMLASRGFVYHSEATAKGLHGYHDHCDCCIVPGKRGRTRIDGYDPKGMYKRWIACAKTVGLDPGTLNVDARKAIMREVGTRDWHWLYTGESAVTDYRKKRYEDLEAWEKKAVDYLSKKHGISLATIKEDDDAPANLDFSMLGGDWELKSPKSGKHAVDDRLTDAFAKFKKLDSRVARIVICNSESTRSDEDVLSECLRRVAYRKKRGEFDEIEFIYLSHDGESMSRYKF